MNEIVKEKDSVPYENVFEVNQLSVKLEHASLRIKSNKKELVAEDDSLKLTETNQTKKQKGYKMQESNLVDHDSI